MESNSLGGSATLRLVYYVIRIRAVSPVPSSTLSPAISVCARQAQHKRLIVGGRLELWGRNRSWRRPNGVSSDAHPPRYFITFRAGAHSRRQNITGGHRLAVLLDYHYQLMETLQRVYFCSSPNSQKKLPRSKDVTAFGPTHWCSELIVIRQAEPAPNISI